MKKEDRKQLEALYLMFKYTERYGAEVDKPEGARYILISDTLANRLADDVFNMLADNE